MTGLTVTPVSRALRQSFAISRGAKTSAETVQVELSADGQRGRGECVPYARYGETVDSVVAQIEAVKNDIESGCSREDLQALMPAGAARCALDCAFWDLEAKQSGEPVWKLAGLPEPRPLPCTMSLSLDTPDAMAKAATATPATLLKLKLGGPEDIDRIAAVHAARPDAKLILDGNEGLFPGTFRKLAEEAAQQGVILIEQPFPADGDDALGRLAIPLAVCADESVHTHTDIQRLARYYDAVNIKLDKAGGLTEALKMLAEARACGLGVMLGCMVAGSLSMAPAVLLGAAADIVDLDGPLWLAEDDQPALAYDAGNVMPPDRALWG